VNDLLEKLEAALAQTEQIARDALDDARWEARWVDREYMEYEPLVGYRDELGTVATGMRAEQAIHMAHNDPKRVLRRVARDRKLIARHRPVEMAFGNVRCFHCRDDHTEFGEYDNVAQPVWWPCDDVRDLAEDYEIEAGR
jgi:hypothetical protein